MKWFRLTYRDGKHLHVYGMLEDIAEKFASANSIVSCGYNPEALNYHQQWCFLLMYPYEVWKHLRSTIRYY